MHILDIFQAHPTTFSFRVLLPAVKTDKASDELFADDRPTPGLAAVVRLSVTYGGEGVRRASGRTISSFASSVRTDLTAVSHLTCVCHDEAELSAILDRYSGSGIENILALGGDPPRNMPDYDRSQRRRLATPKETRPVRQVADQHGRRSRVRRRRRRLPRRAPVHAEPLEGDGLPQAEG